MSRPPESPPQRTMTPSHGCEPAADDEINLAAVLSAAEERTRGRGRGIRQVRAGGGLGEAAERIFSEQRQPSSNRLFYFPTIGSEPEAVRDARYEYRRKTGQQLRSKPHLSDLALDAEAHNLVKTHPDVAERLRTALDAMAQSVRDNPRGWR